MRRILVSILVIVILVVSIVGTLTQKNHQRLQNVVLVAPLYVNRAQVESIEKTCVSWSKRHARIAVQVWGRTKDDSLIVWKMPIGGALFESIPGTITSAGEALPDVPRGPESDRILSHRGLPRYELIWLTTEQATRLKKLCDARSKQSKGEAGATILERTTQGLVVKIGSEGAVEDNGSPICITDLGAVQKVEPTARKETRVMGAVLNKESNVPKMKGSVTPTNSQSEIEAGATQTNSVSEKAP